MKELNDYLEAKGSSTHLKHKRQLAQALGLPMEEGTEQQQSDLLRALKVGAMAITGTVSHDFHVDVWGEDAAHKEFGIIDLAKDYSASLNKQGKLFNRISEVVTISKPV